MNPGPPAPKAGALSWLGYGPFGLLFVLVCKKHFFDFYVFVWVFIIAAYIFSLLILISSNTALHGKLLASVTLRVQLFLVIFIIFIHQSFTLIIGTRYPWTPRGKLHYNYISASTFTSYLARPPLHHKWREFPRAGFRATSPLPKDSTPGRVFGISPISRTRLEVRVLVGL